MRRISIPSKLTCDLAYICGVLAGDGSINIRPNKYDYAVKCVGNPKDEKEFYDIILKNLFKKIFDIEIKPRLHDSGTTYGFSLSSKSLVIFLTEFIGLPSARKNNIEIPPIFLHDKNLLRAFIQGLADTDFCLSLKKRYKNYHYYPVVSGVSISSKLIDQVSDILNNEGFKVSRTTRRYFDVRVNKTEIAYDVSLYGHEQLVKWMQFIGFRHPKHLRKFELWKEINKNNKRAVSAFNKLKEK
ncbi:hypothetical protein HYZ41_03405 [archaeon]|nr:hypothetical protein [archaeon]